MTTGEARWRTRWADRQNQARRRGFETALARWQYDDGEARRMIAAARDFTGLQDDVPEQLGLRKGEVLLWIGAGAGLVETSGQPQLDPPGYHGFPLYQAPPAPLPAASPVDTGTVVVTNRRVRFSGSRNREWAFSNLVGIGQVPDNRTTWMRVTNRVKVSGICLDPALARSFRFALTLGLADHRGDRAGFVAYLEHLLAEHQRWHPQAPPPVTGDQAPGRARFGPGALAAAAVAAVLLLCSMAALVAPRQPDRNPALSTGAATRSDQASTGLPAPTTPAAVPTTQAPAPPAATSAAPPPVRTAAPPPPPAAPPKVVNLCGAPANPYGYTFCGGSLIYHPKPDVCQYFRCINNFANGVGYMIECKDGMVSMSGGRSGSCSYHGGNSRTVYQGS